jgi:hypothetical protein
MAALILSGSPAGLGNSVSRSFQNQTLTGVGAITNGDADGLLVSATAGSIALQADGDVVASGDNIGVATIPAGQQTVPVANTNITAASVILATPMAQAGANANQVFVSRNAGVGFSLNTDVNAPVGGIPVSYWIVKY